MSDEEVDVTEGEPHCVRKSAEETGGEFVRFETTLYPNPQDSPAAADLSHEPWSLDYRLEHVHPEQDERWKVLVGELEVVLDGEEHTLSEGEEMILPEGVPHEHWNPNPDPARVIWERRPAFDDEAWAESLFALAQRGEVGEDGVPGLLQLAVITDAYPDESAYLSDVPVGLQRIGFSFLGTLGRLAGYEATHARRADRMTSEH